MQPEALSAAVPPDMQELSLTRKQAGADAMINEYRLVA